MTTGEMLALGALGLVAWWVLSDTQSPTEPEPMPRHVNRPIGLPWYSGEELRQLPGVVID